MPGLQYAIIGRDKRWQMRRKGASSQRSFCHLKEGSLSLVDTCSRCLSLRLSTWGRFSVDGMVVSFVATSSEWVDGYRFNCGVLNYV